MPVFLKTSKYMSGEGLVFLTSSPQHIQLNSSYSPTRFNLSSVNNREVDVAIAVLIFFVLEKREYHKHPA